MKAINISLGFDLPKLKSEGAEASAIVKKAGAEAASAAKETSDAANKAAGSYRTLTQLYRESYQEAQKLSQMGAAHKAAYLEATKAASQYKKQLDEVNKEIYLFSNQPGVQKVAGQFNGLNHSVAQLSREMPAFANSAQTGFMALSNNIPIFVDQINALKAANVDLAASGQPVKSVFGAVAGALFSWNTLISIGVTLLTVYGGKIVELTSELLDSGKALREQAKAAAEAQARIDKYTQSIVQATQAIHNQNLALSKSILAKRAGITTDQEEAEFLKRKIALDEERLKHLEEKLRVETALFAVGHGNVKMAQYAVDLASQTIAKEKEQLEQLRQKISLTNILANAVHRVHQEVKDLSLHGEIKLKLAKDATNLSKEIRERYTTGIKIQVGGTELAPIDSEKFLKSIDKAALAAKKRLQQLMVDMNASLESGMESAIVGMAKAAGEAMAGNGTPFRDLAMSLLNGIGNLMQELGAQMIAYGTALAIFEANAMNPFVAIAAGVALVAAGAAISYGTSQKNATAKISGAGGSSSGSSSSGGNNYNWQGGSSNYSTQPIMYFQGSQFGIMMGKSNRNQTRVVGRPK